MEFLGKIGCVNPNNNTARKILMITALLGTIVGWAFLIYSDFAVSYNNYNFINAAAYNIGSVTFQPCPPSEDCELEFDDNIPFSADATRYSLGLRAIAYTRYDFTSGMLNRTETERYIATFGEFCDGDNCLFIVQPDKCNDCGNASQAMVASILMSTVMYFFTFTTDVLRIWPNYDVNCQKVFGGFFAIISAIMGLRTWFLFCNQCFASFRKGWHCFDVDLNEIEDCYDDAFYGSVYFHWQAGPRLITLSFQRRPSLAVQRGNGNRNDSQWQSFRMMMTMNYLMKLKWKVVQVRQNRKFNSVH